MPLRICHLISGDLWAGAEVMTANLLKELNVLPDVELSAVVLNHGRLEQELKAAGIPVSVIDENAHSFPAILLGTTMVVRQQSPRIIHAHRYKENILAYLASTVLRPKAVLVTTQHGMPETHHGRSHWVRRLRSHANYGVLARKFDGVVAVSADIQEILVGRYGFPAETVHVIRNGVAVPKAGVAAEIRDHFVVGSAGRFFPVKDYPLMVEIAREVACRDDRTRFELAGDGPGRSDIEALIARYGLQERFAVNGFVEDMNLFYRNLDAYLNTSLHEGIPMSVLEAMAAGLPAIAPKVGGLKEIVTDGVDGYLVEGRNAGDFADRIVFLRRDPSTRRRMAEAARQRIIRDFSTQRMAEEYAGLYRRLVHT